MKITWSNNLFSLIYITSKWCTKKCQSLNSSNMGSTAKTKTNQREKSSLTKILLVWPYQTLIFNQEVNFNDYLHIFSILIHSYLLIYALNHNSSRPSSLQVSISLRLPLPLLKTLYFSNYSIFNLLCTWSNKSKCYSLIFLQHLRLCWEYNFMKTAKQILWAKMFSC